MPQRKASSSADFGDILAALDRRDSAQAPGPARRARRAEPDTVPGAEPETAGHAGLHRPVNRLRRLLGNISLPWPSSLGGLAGGFGLRFPALYAEEAAESRTASQVKPPPREPPNPEAARLEPAKSEDQVIAEELGLRPGLATNDLRRIRRDFARQNHPDRFEPARRTGAERRMSIANMLIDEQMRQSRQTH